MAQIAPKASPWPNLCQRVKIACIEEIALKMEFITNKELLSIVKSYKDNTSGLYLKQIANQKHL